METVTCNLCGSASHRQPVQLTRHGATFQVVRCAQCNLAFMNPRPSTKEIGKLYSQEYFEGKGFDPGVSYVAGMKKLAVDRVLMDSRLATIEKYAKKGRIVDIGCSFGEFLLAAQSRGWNVCGIEFSPFAVQKARKEFKIPVRQGTLEQARFPSKSADVITLLETIEHLHDPAATLHECHRILRPGGLLVIQTGDIESLYAKWKGNKWPYFLAGHLYYFSPNTLSRMLERAGFTVEHIYRGDEISWSARSQNYWMQHARASPRAWLGYAKLFLMLSLRKIGGGMVVYARR